MRLKIRSALVLAATGALLSAGAAPVAMATVTASGASVSDAHCDDGASTARVRNRKAKEPVQDPNAKAYGQIKSQPLMPNGSVHIPTVFHMIQPASRRRARARTPSGRAMVQAQMKVLNDSFSGAAEPAGHATEGADTPFRFDLEAVEFVKNDAWYNVGPGKVRARDEERAPRRRQRDA